MLAGATMVQGGARGCSRGNSANGKAEGCCCHETVDADERSSGPLGTGATIMTSLAKTTAIALVLSLAALNGAHAFETARAAYGRPSPVTAFGANVNTVSRSPEPLGRPSFNTNTIVSGIGTLPRSPEPLGRPSFQTSIFQEFTGTPHLPPVPYGHPGVFTTTVIPNAIVVPHGSVGYGTTTMITSTFGAPHISAGYGLSKTLTAVPNNVSVAHNPVGYAAPSTTVVPTAGGAIMVPNSGSSFYATYPALADTSSGSSPGPGSSGGYLADGPGAGGGYLAGPGNGGGYIADGPGSSGGYPFGGLN
jgi:hypothetical protein